MRPFRTVLIVRFGDVDSAGIVYYPRYAHYLHIGMERFFQEVVGVDYAEVTGERKLGLPTVHLEIDYHRPFRYGDRIEMEVEIGRVGASSVEWLYTLRGEGDDAVRTRARTITVASDLEKLEKLPVPDWLRAYLE